MFKTVYFTTNADEEDGGDNRWCYFIDFHGRHDKFETNPACFPQSFDLSTSIPLINC